MTEDTTVTLLLDESRAAAWVPAYTGLERVWRQLDEAGATDERDAVMCVMDRLWGRMNGDADAK